MAGFISTIAIVTSTILAVGGSPAGDEPSVDEVIAETSRALDRYDSLHFTYERSLRKAGGKPVVVARGSLWRDRGHERLETEERRTNDVFVRRLVVLNDRYLFFWSSDSGLAHQFERKPDGILPPNAQALRDTGQPGVLARITGTSRGAFDGYRRSLPHASWSVSRQSLDDREVLGLTIELGATSRQTYIIDPSRGYLVVGMDSFSNGVKTNDSRFKLAEVSTGAWFPARLVSRAYKNGVVVEEDILDCENVEIGRATPAPMFEIGETEFPEGLKLAVMKVDRSTQSYVRQDGVFITLEAAAAKAQPSLANAKSMADDSTRDPLAALPSRWGGWLLALGGLGVLGVGAAAYVLLRRRSQPVG